MSPSFHRRQFLLAAGLAVTSASAAPLPKGLIPGIGRLLLTRGNRPRLIDPDGGNEADIPGYADLKGGLPGLPVQGTTLSPDGKRVAWIYSHPKLGTSLHIRNLDAAGPGEFIHNLFTPLRWVGPDELLVHRSYHDAKDKPAQPRQVYNLKTRETTPLELAEDELPAGFLDGRIAMTSRSVPFKGTNPNQNVLTTWTLLPKGEPPKKVMEETDGINIGGLSLSPDGSRFAYWRRDFATSWPDRSWKWELFARPVDGSKAWLVDALPASRVPHGLAWEPSGKRLGYATAAWSATPVGAETGALVVVDADGGHRAVITEPDPNVTDKFRGLGLVEWL